MDAEWLAKVATWALHDNPDLYPAISDVLGVEADGDESLVGMGVEGIGSAYEARLAARDRDSKWSAGQFFTPTDVADFAVSRIERADLGRDWLDLCCGVGNLSMSLAAATDDPRRFVAERLSLLDLDATALTTAVVLLSARYLRTRSEVAALWGRSVVGDAAGPEPWPSADFVISNPPYVNTPDGNLYALLADDALRFRGVVLIIPAEWSTSTRESFLRDHLDIAMGGEAYFFDNMPDRLFRAPMWGAAMSSKVNSVRGSIIVGRRGRSGWRNTPWLRWPVSRRAAMFEAAPDLLVDRISTAWPKVHPSLVDTYEALCGARERLADLTVPGPTPYRLDVATSPCYFVSATRRDLHRSSKAVLHFPDEATLSRAAVVLNSSAGYLWWRAHDSGMALTRKVLDLLPVPDIAVTDDVLDLLWASDASGLVTKANAGMLSENVKHPAEVVNALDEVVFGHKVDTSALYTNDSSR